MTVADVNVGLMVLIVMALCAAAAVWWSPIAAKDLARTLARRAFALARSRRAYREAYDAYVDGAE